MVAVPAATPVATARIPAPLAVTLATAVFDELQAPPTAAVVPF